MKSSTRDRIIAYITYHGQARVYDLVRELRISNVAVHKQLNQLLKAGLLTREGKPPIVFYTFPSKEKVSSIETETLPEDTEGLIAENFLSITPDGTLLYGLDGFNYWVEKYGKKTPYGKIAHEYVALWKEQKKHFDQGGWIDATVKLTRSFSEAYVDHLLFEDVYSYKVFGRTKLAKLVMYAKQVGARELIDQIAALAKPVIERIIRSYSINAIAYIPPTVPRPLQFMDEFASQLRLPLPEIDLVKVIPGDIPIPQKTLAGLHERMINARDSIYLKNTTELSYANVLLLDDVVGSGASFHETAKKLKTAKAGKNIVAFALVGAIKGYDVIREI
ncbi:hypothetical protein HY008_02815 [Candidatus Woesebacteria bacterium]|nr:hypothetical protein [Candidatus Woesebacteria bacterium]